MIDDNSSVNSMVVMIMGGEVGPTNAGACNVNRFSAKRDNCSL